MAITIDTILRAAAVLVLTRSYEQRGHPSDRLADDIEQIKDSLEELETFEDDHRSDLDSDLGDRSYQLLALINGPGPLTDYTPVTLMLLKRIVTHSQDLEKAIEAATELLDCGYSVPGDLVGRLIDRKLTGDIDLARRIVENAEEDDNIYLKLAGSQELYEELYEESGPLTKQPPRALLTPYELQSHAARYKNEAILRDMMRENVLSLELVGMTIGVRYYEYLTQLVFKYWPTAPIWVFNPHIDLSKYSPERVRRMDSGGTKDLAIKHCVRAQRLPDFDAKEFFAPPPWDVLAPIGKWSSEVWDSVPKAQQAEAALRQIESPPRGGDWYHDWITSQIRIGHYIKSADPVRITRMLDDAIKKGAPYLVEFLVMWHCAKPSANSLPIFISKMSENRATFTVYDEGTLKILLDTAPRSQSKICAALNGDPKKRLVRVYYLLKLGLPPGAFLPGLHARLDQESKLAGYNHFNKATRVISLLLGEEGVANSPNWVYRAWSRAGDHYHCKKDIDSDDSDEPLDFPFARKIEKLTYAELWELAAAGPRARRNAPAGTCG